jgi:cytochrome c-type biogenesis protein CcmH
MKRLLMSIIAIFLVSGLALAVAVDEKPLADPALEAQARALMKEIRCVVCQNQSIEDSNADLARDMRTIVRERVVLGDSPANVRAYLVDRYGDWVLLKPPFTSSTYLLWGSPLLAVFAFLFLLARRRRKAPAQALNEAEEKRLQQILEADQ